MDDPTFNKDELYGLRGFFDLEYLTVPFGISRTTWVGEYTYMCWASYRIFGIRVAKIQETRPWEKRATKNP